MVRHPFSPHAVSSCTNTVYIVDGFMLSVIGIGSIPVTPSLSLYLVFHVSNFQLNFVFVNHLNKSLNCSATLFPYCVFQDLVTRQTIGGGHKE